MVNQMWLNPTPMVTADDKFAAPDGEQFTTLEEYFDYVEGMRAEFEGFKKEITVKLDGVNTLEAGR